MENLDVKVKEQLEENGYSLVESGSAGFRGQISSQNREAVLFHQMGDSLLQPVHIIFIHFIIVNSVQLMFLG